MKSLSQGDVDFELIPLADDAAKPEPAFNIDEGMTIAVIKTALGDKVADVRASRRLTDSAACLVAEGNGPDRELEKLLARHNRAPASKPVLEINVRHPLVAAIPAAQAAKDEASANNIALLLFEQAQILDGEIPDDPAAFAKRLNELVLKGVSHGVA
jgi:molecular chaperone HtpG